MSTVAKPRLPSAATPASFTHSAAFADILTQLNLSILFTTYQAGQLGSLGTSEGNLHIDMQPYPVAMGLAVGHRKVAVSIRGGIWNLNATGTEIAAQLEPAGTFTEALVPRSLHLTGNIHCHEMGFVGDQLWVVNTLFSCLATIEDGASFVPRWKPRFISDCYAPGDRCHLNGVAFRPDGPAFVTAIAETDIPNGWRERKHETGVIIDVASNEVVTRGLAMPHSPRWHEGKLYVLDSGHGSLAIVDPQTGQRETITKFPGYTRGLSIVSPYAFVGLSRIRETSVFDRLPIAEQRDQLKCGIGIVDLTSGNQLASFQFLDGIEEIFAVQTLPGFANVAIRAPEFGGNNDDSANDLWIVPPPLAEPNSVHTTT